jgi:hypothetical protein
MRTPRILSSGRAFYHVMSRVVDRRMVFGPRDKEIFRRILRNQEAFSGAFMGQAFMGQKENVA